MKIGKISESILKRSVLKQITANRPEMVKGASVGADCAVAELSCGECIAFSTDPVTGKISEVGQRAIHRTVNNVVSAGAEPFGVLLSVLIPESTEEQELREFMQTTNEECKMLGVQLMGGHTMITKAVKEPVVTATGVGKVSGNECYIRSKAKAGADIVVTKWIGLEGTSILAHEKEDELKKNFAVPFIRTAQGFDKYFSVLKDARTAVENGAQAMHDVSEGGIFGALWEFAEANGVGLDINLKEIPIRQETVEICNYFDVNPYQMMSCGSLIIAADHGYDMVRALEREGISAAVIGCATDGNDRTVLNGEERRFLTKPEPDEIHRIR